MRSKRSLSWLQLQFVGDVVRLQRNCDVQLDSPQQPVDIFPHHQQLQAHLHQVEGVYSFVYEQEDTHRADEAGAELDKSHSLGVGERP